MNFYTFFQKNSKVFSQIHRQISVIENNCQTVNNVKRFENLNIFLKWFFLNGDYDDMNKQFLFLNFQDYLKITLHFSN